MSEFLIFVIISGNTRPIQSCFSYHGVANKSVYDNIFLYIVTKVSLVTDRQKAPLSTLLPYRLKNGFAASQ